MPILRLYRAKGLIPTSRIGINPRPTLIPITIESNGHVGDRMLSKEDDHLHIPLGSSGRHVSGSEILRTLRMNIYTRLEA